ncbi:MAG TPA: helix-turn-helix domain-containing protein [Bdellovibrionota bacterium]|nr:helix-turn-helix domain-containing protein [Bdellovibrionota bacterium]
MSKVENATDQEVSNQPEEVVLDRLTWLDSHEAAEYLRKTANALRIMTYRGYVKPRKFRRRLYFRRIELDRLLESSVF